MRRLLRPWILYALALVLGLGAMGWITVKAIRAERAEREAGQRAAMNEKIRLALWRMDSTMALFLSPEAARPWSDYEAFHTAEGGFRHPGAPVKREVRVPSHLLLSDDSLVLLRFQSDGSGIFTSPLVPGAGQQPLVARLDLDPARLRSAADRLQELQGSLTVPELRQHMVGQHGVLLDAQQIKELQLRTGRKAEEASSSQLRLASPFQVFLGSWTPFWAGERLIMARQVWVGGRELLQGCWLDWTALKEVLLSTIRDSLPGADLRPAQSGAGQDAELRLSSLPVRLLPGDLPKAAASLPGASRAALVFGWVCALFGASAGALVLHRATLLSERRGAFASAVAHELRTPLTTFRLYTELLAHGMVPDAAEQGELHRTLLTEADRLDHLVKNVLAYARLESRRGANLEPIQAGALLDRLATRLAERARQAGMELERSDAEELRRRELRTDPLMVEQILLNLVDNACKYASGAGDRCIRLGLAAEGSCMVIRVQDQGPGIPRHELKRLFKPFQKLGPREARSAPGVGLGLALCRRLARMLGGDLRHEPSAGPGACFALSLPMEAEVS